MPKPEFHFAVQGQEMVFIIDISGLETTEQILEQMASLKQTLQGCQIAKADFVVIGKTPVYRVYSVPMKEFYKIPELIANKAIQFEAETVDIHWGFVIARKQLHDGIFSHPSAAIFLSEMKDSHKNIIDGIICLQNMSIPVLAVSYGNPLAKSMSHMVINVDSFAEGIQAVSEKIKESYDAEKKLWGSHLMGNSMN